MKRLWIILILLLFVSCEKSKMRGTWIKENDNNASVYRIYKSNGEYYIDYKSIGPGEIDENYPDDLYMKYFVVAPDSLIRINSNYTSTYILHFPLFDEPYYESQHLDKDYKTVLDKKIVHLIDKSTLLIGTTKYNRYK